MGKIENLSEFFVVVDFLFVFIVLLVFICFYRYLTKVLGNEEPVEPPKPKEELLTKITDVWTLQEVP